MSSCVPIPSTLYLLSRVKPKLLLCMYVGLESFSLSLILYLQLWKFILKRVHVVSRNTLRFAGSLCRILTSTLEIAIVKGINQRETRTQITRIHKIHRPSRKAIPRKQTNDQRDYPSLSRSSHGKSCSLASRGATSFRIFRGWPVITIIGCHSGSSTRLWVSRWQSVQTSAALQGVAGGSQSRCAARDSKRHHLRSGQCSNEDDSRNYSLVLGKHARIVRCA